MRSTFSSVSDVGADAPSRSRASRWSLASLEGLEGRHEVAEGLGDVGCRSPPWSRARGCRLRHAVVPFVLIMRVASRMRSASGWSGGIPLAHQAGEALAITVRASPRVSPASRVSQRSNSGSSAACAALHRLDARAGQHRKGHDRDLPEIGLQDAAHAALRVAPAPCTVAKADRQPVERAGAHQRSAPRAPAPPPCDSRPRTNSPRASSRISVQTPIGSAGSCWNSMRTPAGAALAAASARRRPRSTMSLPRSTSPNRLA